jgi:hypothetical protein
MRSLCASVLALSLMASSSIAGESSALPPGKPAGLAEAQSNNHTFYIVTGALLLVGGVAFLISTDHSATASVVFGVNGNTLLSPPSTSTSSTTTTTG